MRISDWSSDVCSSDLIDQPAARPERRLRRDDMVADGKLTQQRRGHRRHAARLYPARLGALDQRDPFLEHLDGRVLEPRIGHADLVAAEARRDALGAVIAVAGGQERSEEHTSELQSLMRNS